LNGKYVPSPIKNKAPFNVICKTKKKTIDHRRKQDEMTCSSTTLGKAHTQLGKAHT
jgi:hypothetical protein